MAYGLFRKDPPISRVEALEEKVSALRKSRRVLMNLLVSWEESRLAELKRLREENERLKEQNRRFALALIRSSKGSTGSGAG